MPNDSSLAVKCLHLHALSLHLTSARTPPELLWIMRVDTNNFLRAISRPSEEFCVRAFRCIVICLMDNLVYECHPPERPYKDSYRNLVCCIFVFLIHGDPDFG